MILDKENLLNKNKEIIQKRREVLNYLSLLKYCSMIIIIRWHIYDWKKRRIDYGARMCEFLIVSSGFLVGYNYYKRAMPATYKSSCKYAYKHLRSFYPLHIINSLYCIHRYKKKFDLTDYEMFIFNFLLLKVWSNNRSFAIHFNGLSWFISALLFCYFFSPFLLEGIQNINNSIIIFLIVSFIRVEIEELIKKGAKNFMNFNFHHGPIIRLMEFYLGMLMVPLFFKIKYLCDKNKNKIYLRRCFTFIQIIFPVIIYFVMLEFNEKLLRCYFVLIFCLCIFIISYDYGYLSNIIKMKICKEIMSCQMEMYLLHISLNKILIKILKSHFPKNEELKFLINIEFIFIISYIYKKIFREKLAMSMDKIVYLFKTYIFK
jgi:peptidoglycan/LPS O-acetylase OafA/YrhL